VWKFFNKVDTANGANSKFVQCNICNKQYQHSGNTSNLNDHLKRKHPNELIKLTKDENELSDENTLELIPMKKSKQSIKYYMNRNLMYDENSKRKRQLDKLYAKMIATDMLPFRTSEHEGFKKFINAMDNKYELPNKYNTYSKVR